MDVGQKFQGNIKFQFVKNLNHVGNLAGSLTFTFVTVLNCRYYSTPFSLPHCLLLSGIPEGCIVGGQFFAVGDAFIPDPANDPCREPICIKGDAGPVDTFNRQIVCQELNCPEGQQKVYEFGKCCPERCEGKGF